VLQCKFNDGEVISWNKVTTTINNLILGKLYVEHSGTMKVQSEQMSTEVRIKFKDGGIITSSKHQISGRLHKDGRDLQSHKCVHGQSTE
jgi:oxysterol-binding protein 1